MSTINTRDEYIAGLRQFADLLEHDQAIPLPDARDVAWYYFGRGVEYDTQKVAAVDLARRLPGVQKKAVTGDLFRLRGSIAGLKTQIIVDRPAVCERVVTGTETVTRQVPDPSVVVPTVEVTEVVEHVEWVCGPLLDREPAAVTT
jgi:hypothetical protein